MAVETNRRDKTDGPRTSPPTQNSTPPVVWWAWVGAMFVAVEAFTLIAWVTSGNATPTRAIAGDIPTHVKVSAVPGEVYRYPLYEGVFSTFVFAPAGILLYFRDDQGRSVVERGVAKVARTPRRKDTYRVLAMAGVLNTCFLFGYLIPVAWIGLHADQSHINPSYLTNQQCGPGSSYPCPVPGGAVHLGPDDRATR